MGFALAAAGDLDADGYGDLVMGSDGEPLPAGLEARLFYGGPARIVGAIDFADADATFELLGSSWYGLRGVGDVTGDGYDDVALRAGAWPSSLAELHVFAGGASWWTGTVAADAAAVVFTSELAGDNAAWAVAGGDVDGDCTNDLVMGAPNSNVAGFQTGSAYLAYGGAAMAGARMMASSDAIWRGASYTSPSGIEYHDVLGLDVSARGDVDGDGYADLLLGKPADAVGDADGGRVVVVYGGARP